MIQELLNNLQNLKEQVLKHGRVVSFTVLYLEDNTQFETLIGSIRIEHVYPFVVIFPTSDLVILKTKTSYYVYIAKHGWFEVRE